MNKVLMKCGHVNNSEHDGKPSCVICSGIIEGWDEIDFNQPDLTGRKSKCSSCGNQTLSSLNLAFFGHKPDEEFDSHYCGCRGWN